MDKLMLYDIYEHIYKAFTGAKPVWGAIAGFFCYVCFPDRAYMLALMAVLAAATADIFTKSYSIAKKNGGYKKAVQDRKLFSKTLWKGTEVKIVSYLTISIVYLASGDYIYCFAGADAPVSDPFECGPPLWPPIRPQAQNTR